jgi:RNA polymerase sigma-70 factor (ECF subfamily)
MQPTDAELVALVLAGNKDVFGDLVERHSRTLFRVAYRLLGNEEDADEAVQETFLKAYKALERFEQRSNFGTWIYRIAINTSLDMRAKKLPGHTVQISEEPEPEANEMQVAAEGVTAEQVVFGQQVSRKIQKAMSQLTQTERTAFVLRHMEGKSIEEIATVLGLKQNSTKNSIFRAVQKMRRALEPVVAGAR